MLLEGKARERVSQLKGGHQLSSEKGGNLAVVSLCTAPPLGSSVLLVASFLRVVAIVVVISAACIVIFFLGERGQSQSA